MGKRAEDDGAMGLSRGPILALQGSGASAFDSQPHFQSAHTRTSINANDECLGESLETAGYGSEGQIRSLAFENPVRAASWLVVAGNRGTAWAMSDLAFLRSKITVGPDPSHTDSLSKGVTVEAFEDSKLYPGSASGTSQAVALSHRRTRTIEESYEINENYQTSLPQRQQRQPQPTSASNNPRPPLSSSSGSTRTLRRTPKFENQSNPDSRPLVAGGAWRPATRRSQSAWRSSEDDDGSTTPPATRRSSQEEAAFWPQRTIRISRRTADAILFALEEAIRTPYPFTPVLAEENASMADLGGGGPPVTNGRPPNGSSRTAVGPISVPQNPSERVRTPTQIMQERREREARRKIERQREQEVAPQRRAQTEGSAAAGDAPANTGASERPSRGAGSSRVNRSSGGENVPPNEASKPQRDRISGGAIGDLPPSLQPQVNPSSAAAQAGQPTAKSRPRDPDITTVPPSTAIRRTQSQSQPASVQAQAAPSARVVSQPQPRTQPTSTGAVHTGTRAEPSAGTTANRPQNAQGSAPGPQQRTQGTSSGSQQRTTGTSSSFPHAFERWEHLSSHWEGLTSFWLKRLEQNKEEIDRNPLNSQLARQVNDLSAAGANLFHAVVELQRLRASSERKFQRWYFETRDELEKGRERAARLERELGQERSAKADAVAALTRVETDKNSAYQNRSTAEQMVKEMRRELQISKEEARRAWEELGRREQEERDRTLSLRSGQPTLVGGVQVVPMIQGATSGQASTNRPSTREGPMSNRPGPESVESPTQGDAGYTTFDPARSDTDTDPFTEGGHVRTGQTAPRLPNTIPQAQQTSNVPAAALQAGSGANQGAPPPSRGGTYLRYGPAATAQQGSAFYQHEGLALLPEGQQMRVTEADERSYVPSVPDTNSQEEYEMNSNGEIQRDDQGRPILYRGDLGSDDSDEYDVQDQLERERMYGQRYGSGISGVEYGSGSTATSDAPGQPADYSGSGYGAAPEWSAVPRHHHPTRLSDVLEEDERTNRTSPSRATTSFSQSLKCPSRPLLRYLHRCTTSPARHYHHHHQPLQPIPSTQKLPTPRNVIRGYKTVEEARSRTYSGPFTARSAILFLTAGACMIVYFRFEKDRMQRKRIAEAAKGVGKPKVGGKFELVDQKGRTWTEANIKGGFTLIYFGFSHCPDICPDELDKMAKMIDLVNGPPPPSASPIPPPPPPSSPTPSTTPSSTTPSPTPQPRQTSTRPPLLPIFISCDPARDTPAVLETYLRDFHPSLVGLTGTWQQVKDVCRAYRVYFSTPEGAQPGMDYLVDHSIYFYLMGDRSLRGMRMGNGGIEANNDDDDDDETDPDGDFIECLGRQHTPESAARIIKEHMSDWRDGIKVT
ncbi:MAG: hypothetical protein LQ338_006822 [Usnochroma carphineum]|nr:MAG: hypothetical protein LQ338_006822 [Usnochroma carphineum]